MTSNKVLSIVIRVVILSAGSYSVYTLFVVKEKNQTALWVGILAATVAAFIDLWFSRKRDDC